MELAGLRPAQRADAIRETLASDAARLGSPRPAALRCFAAASGEGVVLALPALARDVHRAGRPQRLAICVAGALATVAGQEYPRPDATDLVIEAASWQGYVALRLATAEPGEVLELLPLSLEEQAGQLDRMEPLAIVVPPHSLDDTEPVEAAWLAKAELIARLGGAPAATQLDPTVAAALPLYAALLAEPEIAEADNAAHADPSPERRALRRILRRLDGMGKYGGYHTEFSHLARGFPGHERALALEAGEALLRAGVLTEKPSVGQRHVSLVAARTDEIRRLIAGDAVDDPEIDRFLRG